LKVSGVKQLTLLIAAGLMLALHWSMFFLSIELSTVAIGMITFSTFPLFVTFLEPLFFKEKLLPRNVIAALLIMIGAAVTASEFSVESRMFLGIAAGMLSSLAYAALTLMNRHFVKSQTGAFTALCEQGFAAVALAPVMFFIHVRPTAADIALLALLGVVMTALAHTLFISTLKSLSAGTVGIISSMEAVYGIILALVLLSEIPSCREVIGGLIIVGTVTVSRLQGEARQRAEA
jgi:drug/metabolite transporter (DMT)-like permease